jgi:hypothetical protein
MMHGCAKAFEGVPRPLRRYPRSLEDDKSRIKENWLIFQEPVVQ